MHQEGWFERAGLPPDPGRRKRRVATAWALKNDVQRTPRGHGSAQAVEKSLHEGCMRVGSSTRGPQCSQPRNVKPFWFSPDKPRAQCTAAD